MGYLFLKPLIVTYQCLSYRPYDEYKSLCREVISSLQNCFKLSGL